MNSKTLVASVSLHQFPLSEASPIIDSPQNPQYTFQDLKIITLITIITAIDELIH